MKQTTEMVQYYVNVKLDKHLVLTLLTLILYISKL